MRSIVNAITHPIFLHDNMRNTLRMAGDFLHVLAMCMILHRLLVKKNAQGISLKTQDALLCVGVTRLMVHGACPMVNSLCPYPFISFCFDMPFYNGSIMTFFMLASLVISCSIRRHYQLKSTYRPDQDMPAMERWHHVVVMVLTLSLAEFLSTEGFRIRPLRILWIASLLWEPLSLIPQAILYRRYCPVNGLTGASFLLLMGLYRLLYIADWIFSDNSNYGDEFYSPLRFLNMMSHTAQVLITSCALFWPDETTERHLTTARIRTQVFVQFWREAYGGICPLLVLFLLACRLDMMDLSYQEIREGTTARGPKVHQALEDGGDLDDLQHNELELLQHQDRIRQQDVPSTTSTITPNDADGITPV